MGAGQSSGIDVGGSTMGYQVLRVYPDSPGSRAGLKAYFDFIVAIGNTRFNRENGSLREILKASIDQKLQMVVYNTRTKKIREVDIVPSTNWGGNGLLGVSIKHSSFDRADERVWHVVEVEPGSPAQQAGFKANEDYVIGSDSILQENDDLYNLVEAHEGKALKLFVYNTQTDNCREVICHPNSRWGGKGLLGCEFGHGLLHRIPYFGGDDDLADNPRASLLRNEHKLPETNPSVPAPTNPNQSMNQNHIMQQFQQRPGQQLLQQALSDRPPQQQQPTSSADKVLPPPPPVPQTFAQLATAQFQSQQHQPFSQALSPQISPANVTNSQNPVPANMALHNPSIEPQETKTSYPSQQAPLLQHQIQLLQQPELNQPQPHAQQVHRQQQQQFQQPSAFPQYPPSEMGQPSYPPQQQSLFQQQIQSLQGPDAQQLQSNQQQPPQQLQREFQQPQQSQLPPPPMPPHQQEPPQSSQSLQQTFNYSAPQQTSRRYPAPDLPASNYQSPQVPPNLQIQQQPSYPPPPPDTLGQS